MPRSEQAMKVTTVRFGVDLWRILEDEAARVGISVSQYIREAALARAAGAVAARGADPLRVLGQAGSPIGPAPSTAQGPRQRSPEATSHLGAELRSDAKALAAESRQARRQADAIMRQRDEVKGTRRRPPRTEHQR